jgi:hypothetical protein
MIRTDPFTLPLILLIPIWLAVTTIVVAACQVSARADK